MAEYENGQALREAVEKRLGRALLDKEWVGPDCHPPYDESHLEEVLATLKERGIQPPPHDPLEVARVKMRVKAEHDAQLFEGVIKRIRLELFGNQTAPFNSLEDVQKWITEEATGWGEIVVEYPSEGNAIRYAQAAEGTPLGELARRSSEAAFSLGWPQYEVVRWILMGSWEPPSLIECSFTKTGEVTITIRSPHVPPDFVGSFYQELRGIVWGRERARQFREGLEEGLRKVVALVEFVEPRQRLRKEWERSRRRPESPEAQALASLDLEKETWEKWRIEWNRRYRQLGWGYNLPDSMRTAYRRAKKQIGE